MAAIASAKGDIVTGYAPRTEGHIVVVLRDGLLLPNINLLIVVVPTDGTIEDAGLFFPNATSATY